MVRVLAPVLIAMFLALPGAAVHAQSSDEYAAMLGYLTQTRIDADAFSHAEGALAVNMAAGDLNQQANLRSIAVGTVASAASDGTQLSTANTGTAPAHADAVISGRAFLGANGLASINQASGLANAQLNAVAAALAQRGIRETPDEMLSSAAFASARVQAITEPGAAGTQTRRVGVDRSALQGFEGVLQLNQAAGTGNATGNRVLISVQGPPSPGT